MYNFAIEESGQLRRGGPINIPALAYETYLQFREHPILGNIYRETLERLRRIKNSAIRAKIAQQEVQNYVDEAMAHPLVKKFVSCKKGCAACCHTQVSITEDEAKLLATLVSKGHSIDWHRLHIQAGTKNGAKDFFKLDYNLRRCVFLDGNNACSIYEQRPMVCRTNNVLSEPKLCETMDGKQHPIRMVKTEKANMAMMGAFQANKKNGALPIMLMNIFNKKMNKNGVLTSGQRMRKKLRRVLSLQPK